MCVRACVCVRVFIFSCEVNLNNQTLKQQQQQRRWQHLHSTICSFNCCRLCRQNTHSHRTKKKVVISFITPMCERVMRKIRSIFIRFYQLAFLLMCSFLFRFSFLFFSFISVTHSWSHPNRSILVFHLFCCSFCFKIEKNVFFKLTPDSIH